MGVMVALCCYDFVVLAFPTATSSVGCHPPHSALS